MQPLPSCNGSLRGGARAAERSVDLTHDGRAPAAFGAAPALRRSAATRGQWSLRRQQRLRVRLGQVIEENSAVHFIARSCPLTSLSGQRVPAGTASASCRGDERLELADERTELHAPGDRRRRTGRPDSSPRPRTDRSSQWPDRAAAARRIEKVRRDLLDLSQANRVAPLDQVRRADGQLEEAVADRSRRAPDHRARPGSRLRASRREVTSTAW